MSLRSTIIASLVIAVAPFVIPYKFRANTFLAVVVYSLPVVWLALVVYAVIKYRWRGLWVLIGQIPMAAWILHLALIGVRFDVQWTGFHR